MQEDFEETQLPAEATDPNSTLYGIHTPGGWERLPIEYRFGASMDVNQKESLRAAMRSYELVTGMTLFKDLGIHTNKTGDSFKDLYSSLEDSVNGHYLDLNWDKNNKPPVVLATTIWDSFGSGNASYIGRADIRFNSKYYLIGDSLSLQATDEKEVVDMESLALHELGHLLGLAHVDQQVDPHSIMNPHLFIGEGLISRRLSRGDIERIQQIYGCKDEACDVELMVQKIERNEQSALMAAQQSEKQP